jgi:MerR family transcriptional regulator, mercuric resistance operon regulatory protein
MTQSNTRSRAKNLAIGALSRDTGVHIETIRYYERVGLLPEPPRTQGRHRVYEDTHRQRLVFIRRSRELGFSLDEIRILLGLERTHKLTCGELKALAERHVTGIRQKIRDLKKLERVLSDLAARCHGGKVPACPILDALGSVSPSEIAASLR